MFRVTRSDYVDVDAYDEALNRLGYVFYDFDEAKLELDYLSSRYQTLANRALFIMKLHSGGRFFTLDKNSIFRYLTTVEGCPEHYFFTGKTSDFSIDKNRVLSKLVSNGKAIEFLTEYMGHRSTKTKYDNLKKLLTVCSEVVAEDDKGRHLCKIPFTASVQTNRRFNYRQFDIISQIPKDVANIISADSGYFLAWGDFEQSDFRIAYNLFMRSDENDAIMNKYDDKYEALARIVHQRLGKPFDLEKFKEERAVYKRMTLATVYGTRNSVVPEEQEFIKMFSTFLMQCPAYVEYYNRLVDHSSLKSPIAVTSYWGYEQYISCETYDNNRLLFEALNTPVQTGTSEVVILTINSILKMARECGLSEDQFGAYFTRHDEPLFRIREDAIDYLWILKLHSKVLVDNWAPLAMEFDFGYHYKEPDDVLRAKAKEVYDKCVDSEVGAGNSIVDSEYFPIKPLFMVDLHCIPIPGTGVTITALMDEKTGETMFSIFETEDIEQVVNNIKLKIRSAEVRIAEKYDNVLVKSNFCSGEDFIGGTHVVYRQEYNAAMNKVVGLCKGMVALYCAKNGIAPPDNCTEKLSEFPPRLEILIGEA